jgi:peptidoglycan/LPS O-acetylase OafA/YrhL
MRCLGGFTLGICLQRLAASHFGRMAQSDAFGGCAIGLALLMLLSSAPDLLLYVPFAGLVLCLANNDGRLGAVIGSPPFYTMGLLSYSFYLIHVYFIPPMRAFTGALTPVMPGLIAEVISIGVFVPALLACSWFLYSAVEQPGRNLLRHIGESVARRGAARTVA